MIELLSLVFVVGYAAIAFEHNIKLNKAASALLTGILCWTLYITFSADKELINEQLAEHLSSISGILFFLMGAMTIVELVDAHDGFVVITDKISQTKKTSLIWVVGFITFFLSSVLDNLTTTIVMISLLRKLIKNDNDRLFFAGIVIIAANAGGAWTPIGDVTTTMLWIGNQISTGAIMTKLFLPSMACLLVPLLFLSFQLKGNVERNTTAEDTNKTQLPRKHQSLVFYIGIGALVMVPLFKTITHLPPYMGMLLGLSILWAVTEYMHAGKEEEIKHSYTVISALKRVDIPSILFFMGILLAIAALESSGILVMLAESMTKVIGNESIIVVSIGLLSSIIDNVPLVAAAQGMYDLTVYPQDHFFWEFLAYCAGTGGSILIIGSAAGVAAMGMEKINFFWYMKKISLLALLGYFAGVAVYLLQHWLLGL